MKDEFVFHCQSRNLSPKTTKNYRKQIEYLLNYLAAEYQVTHIEDVKPEHIKTFLVKMKVSHKVNYINDLLKAFKVFFKYAYAEGYTDTLVTEKISNMKKPKVLIRTFSEAELKRLSNYYQGYTYLQLRNRVMLLLLIDTGIRMSELIGLTEEQLKYDYILIRGKGNKERVVPKSPTLSKWLLKFLTVRKSYKYIQEDLFGWAWNSWTNYNDADEYYLHGFGVDLPSVKLTYYDTYITAFHWCTQADGYFD
ncbi:MAG: tyrosine-type recombinase/integrase [Dysosmobacter sp.]|nr:tyrosine-type recombinase/integrase [Dysosmobacter sp.]